MGVVNTSVLRTQLRGILTRPGRLLLTGLSVLVAAFVVSGAVLAYQTVTRTTLDTFSDTPPGTSLVVTVDGLPITDEHRAAIDALPGVAQTVGRIDTTLQVGDSSAGTSIRLVADPGAGPLSRVTLRSGRYPTGTQEIAVNQRAADRLGVGAGRILRLYGGDPTAAPVPATVTGVVDGPDASEEQAYAPDTAMATLTGTPIDWSRVDIVAVPDADLDQISADVSAYLDQAEPLTYAGVAPGDVARRAEARAAVARFDQVFALAAMFLAITVVAAVLVASSTFRIVFAQRMRQLALLRTIGAHRRQLVVALTVEGAIVGLIASAVGVLLATVLGLAAPALASAAGRELSAPGVPVGAMVTVVVGAMLLTAGAGLVPALAAAKVPPLQALRSAGTVAAERGITAGRLLVGLLLVAASVGTVALMFAGLRQPPENGSGGALFQIVAVGAFAFGALIALGPVLIRPVLAVTGWPLRRLGPTGTLAVSVVGGAPRRAAAVSVVVALGVALVGGAVVGTASLRAFTDQKLAARAPADLALFAQEQPITPAVVDQLRALDAVRHVTPFRQVQFVSGDLSYSAIDLDLAALPQLAVLTPTGGALADLGPGRAVLAGTLAGDLGAGLGDQVTLRGDTGQVTVTVAAVLGGEAPLQADVVLAPDDLDQLGGGDPGQTGLLADFAGGVGTRDATVAAVRQLGVAAGVDVAVLADYRESADAEVSSLFLIALGLLALTVLIAVIGVGTTTALSVLERTQESGLLRALGLSRARLRSMILIESGLYGVVGALLGLALGVPLAWLSIEVLRLGTPPVLPAGQLLLIVAALAVITAAAGLPPARRAARVSPIAAIGTPD
ncbi:FtsX-like permease family protein [Micromonospora sp. NBC_01813]|uniref:FtsX-like permease family protein n=1 Tax=Micromonospora sp. NBC_01813 TaxID=2975988 RepID=UPI002DDAAE85|nr:FtsX-like permease family protein [Micromonospora sp. NBC_01813]WSA08908.1 FtsX-like permease family protein [Micromonospora sp. NBC_01813]